MWVNAGVQEQINVAAHFRPAPEWPGTGEHPKEWENFSTKLCPFPTRQPLPHSCQNPPEKSFNPPQTHDHQNSSCTTLLCAGPWWCLHSVILIWACNLDCHLQSQSEYHIISSYTKAKQRLSLSSDNPLQAWSLRAVMEQKLANCTNALKSNLMHSSGKNGSEWGQVKCYLDAAKWQWRHLFRAC